MSSSSSTRLSVTSAGKGRPGSGCGRWYGDGRKIGQYAACTNRMPSFSATDRALAATGNRPVDTMASQSSATAGSLSNCSSINSAMRRGTSATDAGFVPCISSRTDGPSGTSGTSNCANRSAQSGGAHTCTCALSSRARTASANSGSTSPRPPYVDNNTRMSRPHFHMLWLPTDNRESRPGSCRKPPCARYVGNGKESDP